MPYDQKRPLPEWYRNSGAKRADAVVDMGCLPPSLAGPRYYQPTGHGLEKRIGERLEEIRRLRNVK